MRLGPKAVAELILSDLPLSAAPEPLEDVIHRIISHHPDWECVPEEKCSLWEPTVQKHLSHHWDRSLEEGKQPRFAFNSVSPYKVQGACFVEPCDPPEVREQKERRAFWRDYHDALRGLSPNQFERLCTRILNLLGVPKPVLTPYRGDQGIDFFGRMSMGDVAGHGPFFPVFESRVVLWLVGQAKHYRHSKVSTPDIRALVGSATLGRARAFPREAVLPELKIRVCDPVVMLFFATGELSTDGLALCRRAGIAVMDGEMLASFLADKQVGIEGEGDVASFSSEAFAAWLAT